MTLIKEPLRILLVGNGGREHALAWKLSQSPHVAAIVAVPGNGGTSTCPKTTNDTSVSADDFPALVAFAQKERLNFVVPGPEAPLVAGIEGYFRKANIPCYGPSMEAAQLEGSKAYSKDFMKRHNIPTATYETFTDYDLAKKYIDSIDHENHPIVLKADGLAAGKGVLLPKTKEEAQSGLNSIMLDKDFGSAGNKLVIEECLEGDELSILSFCDGKTTYSLPPAQDHKRINDGDQGPNTGGMGCYSPTTIATTELIAEIERTILQPTVDGMSKEGIPFIGTLFTGLMITKNGPRTLEYNVRFGDPETQTLLPLMSTDTDLAEIMVACTQGELEKVSIKVDDKSSATVVVAAGGYPNSYAKGTPMEVSAPPTGTNIFHAGTAIKDNQLVTAGGRVIAAQATSQTLEGAVKKAYEGVKQHINFDKMHYRSDIAYRAFKPAKKEAMTYASAGVSIDAGNNFVERIKAAVKSTSRPGADAEIGGFGGEFDLEAAGYTRLPILVSAIDGVGTKLAVAQRMGDHSTVGIDLVAMNVNDLVVQGAEALYFTDYYGCSKLDLETAASFVEGVAAGCKLANCALVGGETAEMPGMYQNGDYDAAGCANGAMYKEFRLPKLSDMKVDDVLIGVASSGVHSNGFSLVRRIVERVGIDYEAAAPWDSAKSVGASLLTPTRIYVRSMLRVTNQGLVKGLSHITGGGLLENVPRMLPAHLAASIDVTSWSLPPVFKWLKEAGNVEATEMSRTFNTGIGMVAVVAPEKVEQVMSELKAEGEQVYVIGKLVARKGTEGCLLNGLQSWN